MTLFIHVAAIRPTSLGLRQLRRHFAGTVRLRCSETYGKIHCQMLRKVNFTSRNTLSTNNLGARFLSQSAFHVFPLCVYIALR